MSRTVLRFTPKRSKPMRLNSKITPSLLLPTVFAAGLVLSSCEEKCGVEKAADEVGDAIEEVADEVDDAADS